MATAPWLAAWFTAVMRFVKLLLSASTSRMWQVGQMALAICTSSAISSPHPELARGGLLPPLWLIFLKQPFEVVQGGRPNVVRYTPRSASALGLSYASTMAMIGPSVAVLEVPLNGTPYAACRSAGASPEVSLLNAFGCPRSSVTPCEWQ